MTSEISAPRIHQIILSIIEDLHWFLEIIFDPTGGSIWKILGLVPYFSEQAPWGKGVVFAVFQSTETAVDLY